MSRFFVSGFDLASLPQLPLQEYPKDRWIDHHRFAIDGPVLHRDERDPTLLHVYLLSYERPSLIAHDVIRTRIGHADR